MKKQLLYYLVLVILIVVAMAVTQLIVVNTVDPNTPLYPYYRYIGGAVVVTQMSRLRRMFKLDEKEK